MQASRSRLFDIDVIPALADTTNPKNYKPDGVHLPVAGYELTADEIARVVKLAATEKKQNGG